MTTDKHRNDTKGFTIVELLIVIVIIGILAAIVIVAYNGITNRANNSAVEANLSDMIKKLELAKVDNGGSYPFPLTTSTGIHITKNAYKIRNNLYYCYDSSVNEYAVQAQSVTGQNYKIVNGTLSTGSVNMSGQGTCDLLSTSPTWTGSNGIYGYHDTTSTWESWAQ